MTYWAALQPYRNERLRCKNYTYGDQWKDIVSDGVRRMTEEQYIREQGAAPLKNNLIRKIVRNVIGVFRNNFTLPTFDEISVGESWEFDPGLRAGFTRSTRENAMQEMLSRVLEEFLIGGMAVVRKRLSTEGKGGVMTDIVRPESFFFNPDAVDPRGWDIHTIGEIHTVNRQNPHDGEKQRVIEIWRKEEELWRYYFLDESGKTIREGDSPLPSGSHPYVMKAYPFIDGEIHSFVADCIDQQRYINRLITLNDWIIRSSAKGVLLIPDGSIPDDLDLEDITDAWGRYNGVIRYKAKAGIPAPQQVSTNSTNIGISELLGVQLKMMEDVSGINAALQGQLSSGAISGTLYEQQTRHALTGITDLLESFRHFITESAKKDIDLLRLL